MRGTPESKQDWAINVSASPSLRYSFVEIDRTDFAQKRYGRRGL